MRAVRVDGVDRLPELLEAGGEEVTLGGDFPLSVVRALGAIPSYYLRYYYATDDILREQREGASRATDVMRIERELLELYRDPALDRKPELLEHRGGAFYSEAAAALIASLYTGDGAVQVVDTYNRGAIPNLPDDAVVEVPARIDRSGATPIPTAPLAPEMLGLVQHVKAYELLAVEAAIRGEDPIALRALVANPARQGRCRRPPRRDHRGQPALPPPLRGICGFVGLTGVASPASGRPPAWLAGPTHTVCGRRFSQSVRGRVFVPAKARSHTSARPKLPGCLTDSSTPCPQDELIGGPHLRRRDDQSSFDSLTEAWRRDLPLIGVAIGSGSAVSRSGPRSRLPGSGPCAGTPTRAP